MMESNSPMLVRCLMCTTGTEDAVIHLIERRGLGRALTPRKVRQRRMHGTWEEDKVFLLPGYVFVYCEDTQTDAMTLLRLEHVIRVLRYADEPDGWLRGADLAFAQWIYGMDGVIGTLSAINEGSFIRITDGLLKDFNGEVLSVDRRKRLAKVRLDILDGSKIVWLNYDLLKEQETDASAGDTESAQSDSPDAAQE